MHFLFKRLYRATLVAALVAVSCPSAQAVNLSLDGSGQVLIFPFYTTRNGFVTTVSVTNTESLQSKAAVVTFREARTGARVMGFHIWLPPNGIWTGTVVAAGEGAGIYSGSGPCSTPQLPSGGGNSLAFVSHHYTGLAVDSFPDNGGTSLDRTRDGYLEVIEMGVLADGATDAASQPSTAAARIRSRDMSMLNCAALQAPMINPNGTDLLTPAGGLTGSYIIINSTTGVEFAGKAVALQNFFVPPAGSRNALYSPVESGLPDLASVSPARSVVLRPSGTVGADVQIVTDWVAAGGAPIDAVSAVLMASTLSHEFDASPGMKTELIVTMPTKRFYVRPANAGAAQAAPVPAINPFRTTFASATPGDARSCDSIFSLQSDRNGANFHAGIGGRDVCWATSTIVPVRLGEQQATSSIFGARDPVYRPLTDGVAQGKLWLVPSKNDTTDFGSPGQGIFPDFFFQFRLGFTDSGGLRNIRAEGNRYRGLPMIGLTAIQGVFSGQGYGGLFTSARTTANLP